MDLPVPDGFQVGTNGAFRLGEEDVFVFPLSFAEQRLWFLDQWEPHNAAYNISAALRLTGQLDVAAFEQSLGEIVLRHEVLRTAFAVVEGQPMQIIVPDLRVPLRLVDLQDTPASEQAAFVQQLAAQEAQRPFDLTQL